MPPPPPTTPSSPPISPITLATSLHGGNDGEEVSWATGRRGMARRRQHASLAPLAALNHASSPLSLGRGPDDLESKTDLLPLLSPAAQSAARTPDRPYFPGHPKSLSGIAVRAFGLGIALTLGVVLTLDLLVWTSPLWRLPFFLAALSTFHFLEFWTTAAYNTPEAGVKSFLLSANWPAYAIAHAAAATECLVVNLLFPRRSWAPLHSGPLFLLAGLLLVVAGQVVRTAAMVQAGRSFNHIIQHYRTQSHTLVTSGIYATLRHPSYFGFFWWALGTQLVLGNVVCFFAYGAVLWRFFSTRIQHEEEVLVRFFGDEYVDYRKKVGTKIPFIS